ncbi:MAG: deoR-type protein [Candidatus Berkelbacteria bacterium]|nr:deoR-type protein [Candidatus Berkelbacteria bacterium]
MFYFIIGLIVGGVIVCFIMRSRKPQEVVKMAEIQDSNPAVEERKANIEKVKKFVTGKSTEDKITNDDVQNLLKVSDATAERYLQELEKSGKVKQYGGVGKDVYYLRV